MTDAVVKMRENVGVVFALAQVRTRAILTPRHISGNYQENSSSFLCEVVHLN